MRADRILPAGTWDTTTAVDSLLIDYQDRYRRRILLRTQSDQPILLNLPTTTHLRDQDGLQTQHGPILVRAKPEPLLAIAAPSHTLLRIAWHLGNRHLPVQLLPTELRLHRDHVIADMATHLGVTVTNLDSPFDPEPGAYEH